MQFGSRIVLAVVLPLLGMSGVARADVLQVEDGGYNWVSGGPRTQIDTAADLATSVDQVDEEVGTLALTRVSDSAGPVGWRRKVAELAAKYDISPTLLEAVVWQESRWNPQAVSPVGARGLAQLMPGTARMMGVDPNDPHANLEGGAKYLRLQLDAFDGDIERALAAYNAGPARVIRAGGIPPIRETQNYVAAIMSRLAQPVRD